MGPVREAGWGKLCAARVHVLDLKRAEPSGWIPGAKGSTQNLRAGWGRALSKLGRESEGSGKPLGTGVACPSLERGRQEALEPSAGGHTFDPQTHLATATL